MFFSFFYLLFFIFRFFVKKSYLLNFLLNNIMFLKASIERILNDAGTRRKENAELRKACEESLGIF